MQRFSNRDRLNRRLAALPKTVRRAMEVQNAKNAADLVATMKGLAAVSKDSGTLQSTITHRDDSDRGGISQRISAGGSATTRPVRKGAKAFYDYANAVEYGTSDTQATPFFWPAWRLMRRRLRSRMTRATKKAVKDLFK